MPVQYAKQPATAADQTLNPDGHVPTVLDGIPRQLLIGGEWLPAAGGDTMAVLNPAIAQQFTSVADAGVTDAEAAVAAAAAAQQEWALTPPRVRSEVLQRTYQLKIERIRQLATIMTLEMGKPLAEARAEVTYAADIVRWFAEEAVRIDGGYTHRPTARPETCSSSNPSGPAY